MDIFQWALMEWRSLSLSDFTLGVRCWL